MKNSVIKAHKRAIGCLALNYVGSLLATASRTGAKIKIFNTFTGDQLQELRRGIKRAEIFQITFHISSMYLACTSSKDAIHIFELSDSMQNPAIMEMDDNDKDLPEDEAGYKNNKIILDPSVKNEVAKLSSVVSWISSYFSSQWSFSRLKLNDKKKYCAFAEGNNFIVISTEGRLYEYTIPKLGGYCTLKHKNNILKDK